MRWRRVASWAGGLIAVLFLAAYPITARRSGAWEGDSGQQVVGVQAGVVYVSLVDAGTVSRSQQGWTLNRPHGWTWRRSDEPMRWLPGWHASGTRKRRLTVWLPLWLPSAATIVPTVWLWRRDRPLDPGHCPCGYSLAGLAKGQPCPECGCVEKGSQ